MPSPTDRPQGVDGTTRVATDLYYLRDDGRTAMRRLPAGTTVLVVSRDGIWLRVVYADPRYGDESGYLLASAVRVDAGPERSGRAGLSQRGFVDLRAQGFPQTSLFDTKRLIGDALWRQEVQWRPAPWLEFSTGFDLRANSHEQVEDRWRVDLDDRGSQRPAISVRRLTATITAGPLSLDVGRQFIRWGRADILNPTDRFAPKDFVNVIDQQFLAVWGGRAGLRFGDENIDVAYVPRFTPSRIPLVTQRWSVLPSQAAGVPIVDIGAEVPDRSQQGIRWNHVGGRVEFAASFYDGVNHLPDFNTVLTPQGTLHFERTFPQLRTYGGDVVVPTSLVTAKGEVAYFSSPGQVSDEYILYVIEGERQVGEWVFAGGYAGEYVTADRGQISFAAERGMARSIIGRASYNAGLRRSVSVEGVVQQSGDSGFVKGVFSEGLGQQWRLTIEGVTLGGADDDFLGQFRRNAYVAAAMRFNF